MNKELVSYDINYVNIKKKIGGSFMSQEGNDFDCPSPKSVWLTGTCMFYHKQTFTKVVIYG